MNRPLAQLALGLGPAGRYGTHHWGRPEHLHDNLASPGIDFLPGQLEMLNEVSAPDLFFTPGLKKGIFGGATVEGYR